jgi:uncharacterized DUF497 family protein
MNFEWDENKNARNIKKHGVSFVQAAHVFSDWQRKEYYDERHSDLNEDRFIAVGFAGNSVLFVSFTEPEPETVRIISARKAKEHESGEYYGNY